MSKTYNNSRIKKIETNSTQFQRILGLHWKFDPAANKKIKVINFKLIFLLFVAIFLWLLYHLNMIGDTLLELIMGFTLLLQVIIAFISSFFDTRIIRHTFKPKKKRK